MTYPLDKWSRDYPTLLAQQLKELQQWCRVLRTEVYADLVTHCRLANRPVTKAEMVERQPLGAYKAGGIHICPVGTELYGLVAVWGTEQHKLSFLDPETENRKRKQQYIDTMKEVNKKLSEVISLLASIVALLPTADGGAEPAAADEPEGVTKKSLAALIAKKDEKLVNKILGKFGADNLGELEEKDYEKAHAKIEALDDVSGGDGGKDADDGEITLEKIQELAEELITAGKSSEIKKLLGKFDAEKISKMDKKHYKAFHAKLAALNS